MPLDTSPALAGGRPSFVDHKVTPIVMIIAAGSVYACSVHITLINICTSLTEVVDFVPLGFTTLAAAFRRFAFWLTEAETSQSKIGFLPVEPGVRANTQFILY